jgi:hypothetical protein
MNTSRWEILNTEKKQSAGWLKWETEIKEICFCNGISVAYLK